MATPAVNNNTRPSILERERQGNGIGSAMDIAACVSAHATRHAGRDAQDGHDQTLRQQLLHEPPAGWRRWPA